MKKLHKKGTQEPSIILAFFIKTAEAFPKIIRKPVSGIKKRLHKEMFGRKMRLACFMNRDMVSRWIIAWHTNGTRNQPCKDL